MLRSDGWVEADKFKMIVVKGHEVLAPFAFIDFNHAITLILDLMVRDDFVAMLEKFVHLQLALLTAEGEVLNIRAVLSYHIKVTHVPITELLHVL